MDDDAIRLAHALFARVGRGLHPAWAGAAEEAVEEGVDLACRWLRGDAFADEVGEAFATLRRAAWNVTGDGG